MSNESNMVVLGGPTFKELQQLILDINAAGDKHYNVIALLDDNEELHGTKICGVEVKGHLKMVHEFPEDTALALAINNYKRRVQRIKIIETLGLKSDRFPALIHPTGVIDPSTNIGYGSQVYQFCTTALGVIVGNFCMLSPFSLFASDVCLGDGVLTGARVTVLGGVKLESLSFVGSGSIITEGVIVGTGALIGAGSLLQRNVKSGYFTMGYPATQQIKNIRVPEKLLCNKKGLLTHSNDFQVVVNLTNSNNLKEISELIYASDQNFYKLFSTNKEKVLNIIQRLVKDKKSDIGNISILFKDDRIVGLYCWYKASEMWQRQMHSLKYFLEMDDLNLNIKNDLADFKKQLGTVDQKSLYLSKFIISKEFRNLRLSSLLIEDFELRAKRIKFNKTTLHVRASNTIAVKLYKNNGYKIDKNCPIYLVMEKVIL